MFVHLTFRRKRGLQLSVWLTRYNGWPTLRSLTHGFQLAIARRFRARAGIKRNGAEKVVGAQANSDSKQKVNERVILGIWASLSKIVGVRLTQDTYLAQAA